MAFLTLNGLTIPIALGGEVSPVEIGQRQRTVDGTMLRERRAIKREWRFSTTQQQAATARLLRELIMGRGIMFPFDTDANSSGGLAPSTEGGTAYPHNTAADGNSVAEIYSAPSTEAPVAARAGALAAWGGSTNNLPAAQRDAEGTPSADYTAIGGSGITTNAAEYWQGSQSAKVTGVGVGSGIQCSAVAGYSGSDPVTGSVYVYTDGSTSVKLTITDDQATSTAAVFTPDSTGWHRCRVTHTLHAAATTATFKVEQNTIGAKVWSCDGFQQQVSDLAKPWADGSASATTLVYPARAVRMMEGATGITVSLWANGSDSPATFTQDAYLVHLLLGSAASADGLELYFRSADGKFVAKHTDAAGATVSVVASTSTAGRGPWHHYVVAADFAAGTIEIYIDGATEGDDTIAATSLADIANGSLTVGTDSALTAGTRLNGELDRLQVLPYAASSAWVAAEYASGTAPAYDPHRLTLGGDVVRGLTATVLGAVNREAFVELQRGAAWEANNAVLDFSLFQV